MRKTGWTEGHMRVEVRMRESEMRNTEQTLHLESETALRDDG